MVGSLAAAAVALAEMGHPPNIKVAAHLAALVQQGVTPVSPCEPGGCTAFRSSSNSKMLSHPARGRRGWASIATCWSGASSRPRPPSTRTTPHPMHCST